jgi:hypothetical protein
MDSYKTKLAKEKRRQESLERYFKQMDAIEIKKEEFKEKHRSLKIDESSLSRIWNQVTQHESGTISAWRDAEHCGTGRIYSKSEKERRNASLKSQLLKLNYGVTPIKGVCIENYKSSNAKEVHEDAFIVVDLEDKGNIRKDLIQLGKQYDQDFITWSQPNGKYLAISTNTCPDAYPGKGKVGVTVKLGSSFFGKKGEFYSKVKGRPFIFESVAFDRIDRISEHTPTEIRSITMLAKEAFEEGKKKESLEGSCKL